MNDLDWISLIAIAEFAALVTIALIVLIVRGMRRSRRDTDAADTFVQRVQRGEGERRQELETMLAESFGLQGEELEEHAQRLITAERRFYNQFIRTYMNRDSQALGRIDDHLKDVLEPYGEISAQQESANAPARGDAQPDNGDDELDLALSDASSEAQIRTTLRRLSEDLSVYRDTLNRLFSEYTAMFGVDLDPKAQLSAREIIHRLETGQLSGAEDEEREQDASQNPG